MSILEQKFFTISEVASLLRVSRSTLWALRKSGKLVASIRVGSSERYTMGDIERQITIPQPKI